MRPDEYASGVAFKESGEGETQETVSTTGLSRQSLGLVGPWTKAMKNQGKPKESGEYERVLKEKVDLNICVTPGDPAIEPAMAFGKLDLRAKLLDYEGNTVDERSMIAVY